MIRLELSTNASGVKVPAEIRNRLFDENGNSFDMKFVDV